MSDLGTYNEDVYVTRNHTNASRFAPLGRLVLDKALEQSFATMEDQAKSLKKQFNTLGKACLVLTGMVVFLLGLRLALGPLIPSLAVYLAPLGAILGGSIVALQLRIISSGLHQRWIYHRFQAEFIRCWRYQRFLDGDIVSAAIREEAARAPDAPRESPNGAVTDDDRKRETLLSGGTGALEEAVDGKPADVIARRKGSLVPEKYLAKSMEAYRELRLDWQVKHFLRESKRLSETYEWSQAFSRSTFVLSGILAVVDMMLYFAQWLAGTEHSTTITWIEALLATFIWATFVSSVVVLVYERGMGIEADIERYHDSIRRLLEQQSKWDKGLDPQSFADSVAEIETVCLEEMKSFLRSARKRSFFI